jgi:hypothetical protein
LSPIAEGFVDNIARLEHRIRALINDSSFIFQYLIDQRAFGSVCSALDVLGDSEVAFGDWLQAPDPDAMGLRYVAVFGVLQMLFVQQDAVTHLCSAFGVKPSADVIAELGKIREIRNPSTGHPVLRDRDGSSHHIARATLSAHGFQMASYWPNGKAEYRNVNLAELVKTQGRLLAPLLTEALRRVTAMENEHRQRFRSEPLASTINDYLLQKLWEAVHDADRAPMGTAMTKMIRDMIDEFEKALLARIPTSPLTQELGSIRHALVRLDEYFGALVPTEASKADADVFVAHVVDRLRYLREIAAQIDTTFERDVA